MHAITDRGMSRREVLARAAKTGVAASGLTMLGGMPALVRPGKVNAATGRSPFAPDGLLYTYVEGSLVSASNGTVVVVTGKPGLGPATIAVPSSVPVTARGITLPGDLSQCQLGDTLSIATDYTPTGQRIAKWMYANFVTATGIVSVAKDDSLTVTPVGKYVAPSQGQSCDIAVLPMTAVHAATLSRVGSAADIAVGNKVYFVGTANAPGLVWPLSMWAESIHQLF